MMYCQVVTLLCNSLSNSSKPSSRCFLVTECLIKIFDICKHSLPLLITIPIQNLYGLIYISSNVHTSYLKIYITFFIICFAFIVLEITLLLSFMCWEKLKTESNSCFSLSKNQLPAKYSFMCTKQIIQDCSA